MWIVAAKEIHPKESRVALTPKSAEKLIKLGANVAIEAGLGSSIFPDESYEKVGVKVFTDKQKLFDTADLLLKVRRSSIEEISMMKKGTVQISFLNPFQEQEIIEALKTKGVTALSMEMIPRTTIAQKMDALSSQANLGGYVSVVTAAFHLQKVLPMMTTPSGTISPAKVFIIGAGVAGLQAIATAKRLGARVEAFDTRAVVEEQVKSLGAKFIKIDLGETEQTKDGYAKPLTESQIQKQRDEMAKICASSDIVITTAQVFGRKAPIILTQEMIKKMSLGSVIVDMAVESGGNVEGVKQDEILDVNGVKLIGLANLPAKVAFDASEMYASNLYHLIHHFWDVQTNTFQINPEDELLKRCIATHQNETVLV